MQATTLLASNLKYNGAKFDNKASFFIPYDLGVTFGSIYDSFRKWIVRDLDKAIKFNTINVRTQITSDKRFLWHKAILAQAQRPCLSLQATIDHSYESEVFKHPAFRNWEAVHFLEPQEFNQKLISLEDNLDLNNNLEVAFAMKSVQFQLSAGIVFNSRYQADNIANYWTTRRSSNYYYPFDLIIDFKIPEEIIEMIIDKFKLEDKGHHEILKWLNRHSHSHIYYTMDGFNGKKYYFFRYKARPLIKPTGFTNPTEYEIRGTYKGESYTIVREFEVEVLIPSIMSIKKYGDRIEIENYNNKTKTKTVEAVEESLTRADIKLNERYIEIERVIENKHALKEIEFNWSNDDLVTHPNGSVTTKKIDLNLFLDKEHDKYIHAFINWGTKIKGYTLDQLFNFQLYKAHNFESGEHFKDPKIKERKGQDINVPVDGLQEKEYIKNMREFYIIDLKPNVEESLIGILYCDLLAKNQFDYYYDQKFDTTIGNDDLGIIQPYGPSKVNVDIDNYK